MTAGRPAQVLHLIDGLEGGGSERLLFDIVRLSEGRVRNRVATVYRESAHQVGPFVYAAPLRALGAYRDRPRVAPAGDHPIGTFTRSAIAGGRLEKVARSVWTASTVVAPGLYRASRELVKFRPDVIHAHLYHAFVCGLVLKRLTGRPLVHQVPAMSEQMHDVSWMPRLYRCFHPLVDRFITGYPDELRRLGVPEAKIQPVRGALDTAAIDAAYERRERDRLAVRATLGIPPDALVALSVGRLHPSKGHELAARTIALAAERFPELHWVVLGEGAERGRLEALVRDLGIAERAHLPGFTTDVLPWYAAADLYLRTTTMEAENLSSHQAMAMGLPVVGFAGPAATDLLERVGHGIAVPAQDPSLLAAAIGRVLGSADRGRALGLRGREHARRELGIDLLVERLTGIYEGLAGARAR